MYALQLDHRQMARRPRKLYIGEWIFRFSHKPVEIAKLANIGESYLSQLISGKKKNQSAAVLIDIANVLRISMDDLYQPPPPSSVAEATERLTPSQIAVLGRLLDNMKGAGRK